MKISIPEPCSEDWSKMTPTEQGAFCQKCALEVTDFTRKSAWEIKSILTEKIQAKQRVCGRIEDHQLVQVNHDFIHWKSDQESFRAIWMFSLVAVFGFTLFSCQSTFSKEMVEKMNTTRLEMIDEPDENLVAEIDSTTSPLMDSSFVTIDPWEIVVPHGGTVMLGGFGLDFKVITMCGPYTINFVVGDKTTQQSGDDLIGDSSQFAGLYSPPTSVSAPLTHSPRVHDRPVNNLNRADAKLEDGNSDFEATISPNPVDETSKVFVAIPNEGMLEFVIKRVSTQVELHREVFELLSGKHQISVNFMDFAKDEYEAILTFEEKELIVAFTVGNLDANLA